MDNNKPVAVIILNWNGEALLQEFLPKVIATTNEKLADIIVADNGSTDNSVEFIEKEFPNVKLLKFTENYGFAEGYNQAIAQTRYKYTILLNSDAASKEGWIEPIYEYMEAHPQTGACQPKLLSYTTPDEFEYAGASGGFIDKNGYPYCRGRLFSTVEKDNGQYDDICSIFWATGAALAVRSDLYLKVGGLDKLFFAHMEEIDLCWRILLAGYDIKVIPQSIVYHLGGGSLPASNPRKTYLNFRNNLLLLHKNLPDSTRSRKLFVRRLYDTIAWAKFVATLDFKNANAILKAHNDFRQMRKQYNNHPSIDLLDTRTDTHRNIILDYYLRGKKYWEN
ncbi:MAG: glycosyltransferase family 2 protein [Muribaculaceae bacterium]|nr:glycosyltransferase family 2 protein [Muribaculaceae bacterium]